MNGWRGCFFSPAAPAVSRVKRCENGAKKRFAFQLCRKTDTPIVQASASQGDETALRYALLRHILLTGKKSVSTFSGSSPYPCGSLAYRDLRLYPSSVRRFTSGQIERFLIYYRLFSLFCLRTESTIFLRTKPDKSLKVLDDH